MIPPHQIRATYTRDTIVVYQAYRPAIADAALQAGRFVPPFSTTRMTWIKPSFLWMAARSGWGRKSGQERILAVHLHRSAFDAALAEAVLTAPHAGLHAGAEDWRADLEAADVRVQWDPERSLRGAKLPHRSIQVGIGRGRIDRYATDWIAGIEDQTALAHQIHGLITRGDARRAKSLLPVERPYPVPDPGTHARLDLSGDPPTARRRRAPPRGGKRRR